MPIVVLPSVKILISFSNLENYHKRLKKFKKLLKSALIFTPFYLFFAL
jgi:hypothetical protein